MVNRVELDMLDEFQKMRELDVTVPVGFKSVAMPATKSLSLGTCARTLLPMIRSARRPSAASRRARGSPKNSTSVGTRSSRPHAPPCRMDRCPARDARVDEVLQKIAVVAGELHYQAARPRPKRWRAISA